MLLLIQYTVSVFIKGNQPCTCETVSYVFRWNFQQKIVPFLKNQLLQICHKTIFECRKQSNWKSALSLGITTFFFVWKTLNWKIVLLEVYQEIYYTRFHRTFSVWCSKPYRMNNRDIPMAQCVFIAIFKVREILVEPMQTPNIRHIIQESVNRWLMPLLHRRSFEEKKNPFICH